MKNKIVIMNMWGCTIWAIFIALLCFKGAVSMEWWQTLLVAVIPAAISAIVTLCISRKSQINSNTYQISKLTDRLGIQEDKTLHADISDKFNSIMSDIGRNENASLTKQHNEMKHMLIKEIEVSERRYKDEEERIRNFTIEQHNTNKSLDEFKLFMESWQRMAANSHNQNIRILELEEENHILKDQLSEFVGQTEGREHEQSL